MDSNVNKRYDLEIPIPRKELAPFVTTDAVVVYGEISQPGRIFLYMISSLVNEMLTIAPETLKPPIEGVCGGNSAVIDEK